MNIDNWKTQMRKGAAELTVLSVLNRQSLSGIGLLSYLKPFPDIGLSEGTLYPLLKRLERDGRLIGEWQLPENGGRPTKTYTLSPDGDAALKSMLTVWASFRDTLSDITGETI
ncbi:MAG: PadR family transcriptional regulator [Maricaulaceae bacterium]